MTKEAYQRGQSATFLKKLRKRYGLGEFRAARGRRGIGRPRRSRSTAPRSKRRRTVTRRESGQSGFGADTRLLNSSRFAG